MRIAYVARHDAGGNRDERAVAMALESLGHEVVLVHEQQGHTVKGLKADLVLFHKWRPENGLLRAIKAPKVFWYWDCVQWPGDPTLADRSRTRHNWMNDVVPFVDCGFLTDGDYVDRRGSRNLCWLPQGVDGFFAEKLHAEATIAPVADGPDVLLTGIAKGGGQDRVSFVREMEQAYGRKFKHVRHGCHGVGLYREINAAKVVVAPDSPVTDKYWSNRVYLSLGYGAFLLHPASEGVSQQYRDGHDLVFYRSRMDLHAKIAYFLGEPLLRRKIAMKGLAITMARHTYRHRLIDMFIELHRRKIL